MALAALESRPRLVVMSISDEPFVATPRSVGETIMGTLGTAALGVFWHLEKRANGGQCWPSLDDIAEATRLSRKHVTRVLDDLESGGWITREKRTNAYGMQTSTLYTIVEKPRTDGCDIAATKPGQNEARDVTGIRTNQEPNNTPPAEVTPPVSPKAPGKPKRTKTYLPDDFTVSDRMYDWAFNTYQLSSAQVDEKTERMRRYCLRNAKQYADWEQAWRGFMEPKSWDSSPAPPNGVHRNGSSNPSAQDFFARAAELAKEDR